MLHETYIWMWTYVIPLVWKWNIELCDCEFRISQYRTHLRDKIWQQEIDGAAFKCKQTSDRIYYLKLFNNSDSNYMYLYFCRCVYDSVCIYLL